MVEGLCRVDSECCVRESMENRIHECCIEIVGEECLWSIIRGAVAEGCVSLV